MCLATILFRFMQSILPLSAVYKLGVGGGGWEQSVCVTLNRIMSLEEMTEIAFVGSNPYSHMTCIVLCYQCIL